MESIISEFSVCLSLQSVLMAFSLFAGNTFEVFHFGGGNRWTDEINRIDLRHLATALIVFDENLNILNILEFHVTQIDWISSQVLWINPANQNRIDKFSEVEMI